MTPPNVKGVFFLDQWHVLCSPPGVDCQTPGLPVGHPRPWGWLGWRLVAKARQRREARRPPKAPCSPWEALWEMTAIEKHCTIDPFTGEWFNDPGWSRVDLVGRGGRGWYLICDQIPTSSVTFKFVNPRGVREESLHAVCTECIDAQECTDAGCCTATPNGTLETRT